MTFLPEDYQPPANTGGNYLKLQQGANKLRILTSPLLGWELWDNQHVQRFTLDKKPEGGDKPREFWSMIAWNYGWTDHNDIFIKVDKIQLLHLTQGSIKKAIRDLAQNDIWGSPVDYDLIIVREGHQLKTNYSVIPRPQEPLLEHIKEDFVLNPCWLPALLTGDDPFADTRSTIPLWEQSASNSITEAQYKEIVDLIGDDTEYMDKVTTGVKKTYNIESLNDLPSAHYEKVLAQVKMHCQERLAAELEDALPF